MAEDPDAIPSLQLAWEMIELARVIYKARDEVKFHPKVRFSIDFQLFKNLYLFDRQSVSLFSSKGPLSYSDFSPTSATSKSPSATCAWARSG